MRFEARSVVCGGGRLSRPPGISRSHPGPSGSCCRPTGRPGRGRKLTGRRPLTRPAQNVRRRFLHVVESPPPSAWTEVGRSRRTDRDSGSVYVGLWSPAAPGPGGLSCAWPGRPGPVGAAASRGTSIPQGTETQPEQGDVTGSQSDVSEPGEPCRGGPHMPWGQGPHAQHGRGTGAGREGTAPQSSPIRLRPGATRVPVFIHLLAKHVSISRRARPHRCEPDGRRKLASHSPAAGRRGPGASRSSGRWGPASQSQTAALSRDLACRKGRGSLRGSLS